MANTKGRNNQPAPYKTSRILSVFANRKRLAILVIVIAILGYFGYQRYRASSKKPTYQTAQAQRGSLVSSVSASGQVLSTNNVNVTTSASGVVSQVYVKDGDQVSAGSKIAQVTLDLAGSQQYNQATAAYLAAKTSLDSANVAMFTLQSDLLSKWKAFTDLATSSQYQNADGSPRVDQRTLPQFMTVQDNWLAAEQKYKDQQTVIAQAKSDLASRSIALAEASPTITAPIAGTVSNLGIVPNMTLGSQGSSVSVGTGGSVSSNTNTQEVAVIQNESTPIATFNASETDIGSIKLGDSATVTLSATGDKTFTGKVVAVDKIGTVSSGVTNYKVLISFDTESGGVLPNMAASAKIITNVKDNVILVPSTAIQTGGGQSTVRVMRNGNPISVPVEVGDSNDTQTEIISGISEGDTIVTSMINPTGSSPTTGATSPFGIGGGGRGGAVFRGGGGGGDGH